MGKRLIGVGHTMRVVLLLYGVATIIGGIENLGRETIGHRLFAARTRVGDNPTNSQGTAPLLVNFNRNLISRTTNASGLNFHRRLHVIDGSFENLDRKSTRLNSSHSQISYAVFCL